MVRPGARGAEGAAGRPNAKGRGTAHRGPMGGGVRHGFDGQVSAPWRKMMNLEKLPVTLVRSTHKETKPTPPHVAQLTMGKPLPKQEKPRQVFWAKRLEGMRAIRLGQSDAPTQEPSALPARMHAVGPAVSVWAAASSLNAALANPSPAYHPVMGQTNTRRNLDNNVAAFINPDQPLVQAVVVSDADIVAQERRVLDARKRLEHLRKQFGLTS